MKLWDCVKINATFLGIDVLSGDKGIVLPIPEEAEITNRVSQPAESVAVFFAQSLCLSILLLLSSCGYHIQTMSSPKTISVPFVRGDESGQLTNQVIYLLNTSGEYRTTPSGGSYTLCIDLIKSRDQNIGFRYDRGMNGKLSNTIVPAETRAETLVEVTLRDNQRGCNIIGPARVSASYDFDHEWYSSWGGINVFSLGQVTDYGDAKDQVQTPLNRVLAQKIVDLLLQ